jgi:hypothetical protein
VPHHEQQASKWNGEKRHRELWPAYNPNIAPPQASTEGLFQQTLSLTMTAQNGAAAKGQISQCEYFFVMAETGAAVAADLATVEPAAGGVIQ